MTSHPNWELNEEQKEVVFQPGGPLLVLAGAGSGKTRTLTYRVAWLMQTGVSPTRIMLATFTNKAARSMLERVSQIIGNDLPMPWGGTFHSIGHRILRRHADLLGYGRDFTIVDTEDATQIINTCLAEKVEKRGKRFPKGDVIREIWSLSVNTRSSLEECVESRFPHLLDYLDDMKAVIAGYRERKRLLNVMDFDDLLINWCRLFLEFEDLKWRYADHFLHVLIDEYQDINTLQGEIADLVAMAHRNIMVVGDDSQSIYSFRGADFRNILTFPERYQDCRIFRLETNYRSTPEILRMANLSIKNNTRQFPKVLKSVRKGGKKPVLIQLRNAVKQAEFVAQKIEDLKYREGIDFKSIAVLYRAHYQSMELQMELVRRGVPFELRSGIRFFEQAHVKDVAAYLRILVNGRDEMAWRRVLNHQEQVGPATIRKVWQEIGAAPDPLSAFLAPEILERVSRPAQAGVMRLQEVLGGLAKGGYVSNPAGAIAYVVEHGYAQYLTLNYADYRDRMDDLTHLADFAARFYSLEDFLGEVALLTGPGEEDYVTDQDRVVLSTIHQAKGLEWRVVFLIWVAEGKLPLARALNEPEGEEEERRLFYVAVTRAKDHLFLSYPAVEYSRAEGYGYVVPSRFLREIQNGAGKEFIEPFDYYVGEDS
ncbi:MAG TPA: ATP-dependent helicase [Syntrophales bacterium]|nr:ATP-dependent helicase [Syntrophales bacterium]HOL58589.1 ATP-dependent helicase [Syntrophales bacterium]HPO34803.1 ATP-dependent helicase [Syntrophales bacterium]